MDDHPANTWIQPREKKNLNTWILRRWSPSNRVRTSPAGYVGQWVSTLTPGPGGLFSKVRALKIPERNLKPKTSFHTCFFPHVRWRMRIRWANISLLVRTRHTCAVWGCDWGVQLLFIAFYSGYLTCWQRSLFLFFKRSPNGGDDYTKMVCTWCPWALFDDMKTPSFCFYPAIV